MSFGRWIGGVTLSLFAVAALVIGGGGCGQADNKAAKNGKVENKKEEQVAQNESGHSFKGRDWCAEHGLAESICTLCNSDLVPKYKEKGDWCEKHDRPNSQCFICNPKLKAEFAKEYTAKYGEDPPPTEDEEKKGDS